MAIPSIDVSSTAASTMDRALALNPIPTVVLDSDGVIMQVSQGFRDVTGMKEEEYLSKSLKALHVPIIHASLLNEQMGGTDKKAALKFVDGKYWRTRLTPILDRGLKLFMVEAEDVTEEQVELKKTQDRLQSYETYRILVDTVKDYAIFMLDPTGHIATWNTGASLLKQYKAEEIIGRHFRTFYSQQDKDAKLPEMELELAVKDGKFEDSGWRYRKDGSKFYANVVITPSYRNGKLVGFTKVTRDMTEKHAAEARIIAEYEMAAKLKNQFLANMSHEIRSPMHGMLSALTLLLETGLDAEQRELAGIAEESGSILLQVINDILDYSKLSSGAFQMNTMDMSIKDTIHAVVRSTSIGLKPTIKLHSYVDPKIPDPVNGDPLRLRQVLQNIVLNAVKFTEVGSVDVTVTLVEEDSINVTFLTEVADTGLGVPITAAPTLFTPFMQLDNSATKKFQGTGLGLSICKSLVELMGGSIGYRPNPIGVGSIFWFELTMAKVQSGKFNHMVDNNAISKLNAAEKRLLLVEDNVINQKVMAKTLAKLGYNRVDMADDGQEAIYKVQRCQYNLIFMDVSMPVLDGVQATKRIRALGCNVPIIAMTANALKGDRDRFLDAGMSDYLAKPVDRRLLVEALGRWMV
jgi:osomolarity two-component system, sensor histidine kinase TcsA